MLIKSSANIEAKCNFCFEWIYGAGYCKKQQNICSNCLFKAQNDEFVINSEENTYRLLLLKREANFNPKCENKSILLECADELMGLQVKEVVEKWNALRYSLNERQNFTIYEKNMIEEKLQKINESSQDFHLKIANQIHSISSQKPEKNKVQQKLENINENLKTQPNENNQSEISIKPRFSKSSTRTPFGEIDLNIQTDETLDTSLDSGISSKYSYYFDRKALMEYRSEQKIGSSNEFDLNLANQFFLNLGRPKPKSNRSNVSQNQFGMMSKDEIKTKITSLLADKYQSQTYSRLMASLLASAYLSTCLTPKSLQLINFNISELELSVFLNLFDFERITVFKFVNVGMSDAQLRLLLDFVGSKRVETLVLTGNKLTENSLGYFLSKSLPNLKQLYLGKNRIYRYRVRATVMEMRNKFMVYL